jgi:hypothetical protein
MQAEICCNGKGNANDNSSEQGEDAAPNAPG